MRPTATDAGRAAAEAVFADAPLLLPDAMRTALVDAYATPHRAYHNLGHVAEVLTHFQDVARTHGWRHVRETWLAVLYHDAVYVPGKADNEARSAQLARAHAARWLPDAGIDIARVEALILLTARHGRLAPQDFQDDAAADDSRRLLDCDMAILGASPDRFDAYDRAIAAEYQGHVPGLIYRMQRRRFLKALLARPRIFLDDDFHARLDAQARSNLRRAITTKR